MMIVDETDFPENIKKLLKSNMVDTIRLGLILLREHYKDCPENITKWFPEESNNILWYSADARGNLGRRTIYDARYFLSLPGSYIMIGGYGLIHTYTEPVQPTGLPAEQF